MVGQAGMMPYAMLLAVHALLHIASLALCWCSLHARVCMLQAAV
jgi:hypothetical protein